MKAILIDAKNKEVRAIEFSGDYREMYQLIGCECFTCAVTLDNGDALYVDDEGLINGQEDFFFCPVLWPEPLAGNGLLLGTDDEGESVDVQTPLSFIRAWFVKRGDQEGIARMMREANQQARQN